MFTDGRSYTSGLGKNLNSSFYQGDCLLVLVRLFMYEMTLLDPCLLDNLAWLKMLLAQQGNLIVPENRTGLFRSQVIHTATLGTSEFAVMNLGITKAII